MHHSLDSFEDFPDKLSIPDISMDEFIARIVFHILHIVQVSGIGEFVQVDDFYFRIPVQQIMDEVAADKARSTCNQ